MARIAAREPAIRKFSFEHGKDRGPYLNFSFTARSIGPIWPAIEKSALAHPKLGPSLRRSTIITCQGSKGWDNYLLLHHFDKTKQLDEFVVA
jgi:hypothetical protein